MMPSTSDKRAAIKTLGCKLNQYESEQIREQLESRGYRMVPFDSVADVYIVNSCTVTSRTDRECRRLLRHAKALNPRAVVVVTGCYAEVDPQRLADMPAVDLVVPNADKPRLAALLEGDQSGRDLSAAAQLVSSFAGHTRAFVKVQEGCDANCAYCIIPRARGPSRSVPPDLVIEQARRLVASGHPELVLIGTHLGKYGRDLPQAVDLVALCDELTGLADLGRLRLSSIEPLEIPDSLVAMVAAGGHALQPDASRPGQGKLCRHFHIPLQSGCDAVLRRMKSDEQFEQTRDFLASLPLSYLHVFTYSPRPGTAAAQMPGQLPGHVKKRRNHLLRELSERKRQAFGESLMGEVLEVVVERFAPRQAGCRTPGGTDYPSAHHRLLRWRFVWPYRGIKKARHTAAGPVAVIFAPLPCALVAAYGHKVCAARVQAVYSRACNATLAQHLAVARQLHYAPGRVHLPRRVRQAQVGAAELVGHSPCSNLAVVLRPQGYLHVPGAPQLPVYDHELDRMALRVGILPVVAEPQVV